MPEFRNKNSRIQRIAWSLFFYSLLLIFPLSSAASLNIENVLKEYIKSHFPWAEIEIHDLIMSKEVSDEIPVRIGVEKGPPGKTIFKMRFKNGTIVKATANVRAFDEVIFTERAFRKGYHLQKEDFYVKLMDVTRIPKGAVKNTDEVINKTLTRSVVANAPILDNMVSDKTVIKRGCKVTLIVESPSFIITTLGEVRENAYVGGSVKAINPASKKVVSGLLVDENTVKVEF
jgi:flagella basal body P-ring formation protein FlgA